jgi:LysM repeat protein
MTANGYTGDPAGFKLYPGKAITLPPVCKLLGVTATTTTVAGKGGKTTTTTTKPKTPTSTIAVGPDTYTVLAGESIGTIAKKLGYSATAIASVNGFADGPTHLVHPGQVLKLPAKKG